MIEYDIISKQELHHYLVISNSSLEEKLYQVMVEDKVYQLVYLPPGKKREIEITDDLKEKIIINDITR